MGISNSLLRSVIFHDISYPAYSESFTTVLHRLPIDNAFLNMFKLPVTFSATASHCGQTLWMPWQKNMFKLPVICGSARLESSEVPVGAVGTKLLHSPPGQIHQMPQILQTPQMPMSGMSGLLPPGVGVSEKSQVIS